MHISLVNQKLLFYKSEERTFGTPCIYYISIESLINKIMLFAIKIEFQRPFLGCSIEFICLSNAATRAKQIHNVIQQKKLSLISPRCTPRFTNFQLFMMQRGPEVKQTENIPSESNGIKPLGKYLTFFTSNSLVELN